MGMLCGSARLAEEAVPFMEDEAEHGMSAAPKPKPAPKPAPKPLAQPPPYPPPERIY